MAPGEYLSHLKFLRDDFSDEIPEKILHSPEGQQPYKVRKSWFQGVIADAASVIHYGYATDRTKKRFEEFVKYYKSSDPIKRLTTKEGIDKANSLLTSLICDLEKICGLDSD